ARPRRKGYKVSVCVGGFRPLISDLTSSLGKWHSSEDGVASGERWRVTTGEPRTPRRGSLVFSTHSNVGAGKSPRSAGSAQPDSGRTPSRGRKEQRYRKDHPEDNFD